MELDMAGVRHISVRKEFKILHTPGRQITNFSLFWADTAHSGWVENLTSAAPAEEI